VSHGWIQKCTARRLDVPDRLFQETSPELRSITKVELREMIARVALVNEPFLITDISNLPFIDSAEKEHATDYDKASGLDVDRDVDRVRRLTSRTRRNSWPLCKSPRGQSTISLAHARASSGSVWSIQKPVSTLYTSPLVSSGLKRLPRSLASLT